MSGVELHEVGAAYGRNVVLRDLTLRIRPQRLTAVLGPSGCGKSTMVRVVAGFHRVSRGRVTIDDRVVDGPGVFVNPEKRCIGVVPQNVALFPHLDVAGNVGYGLRRWGRYDKARVEEVLELVGLPGAGAVPVHQLSGGQQQRVAVARALAPRPAAVLLDEPFSALDQGLRESVRADVRAALAANRTTAVLVTHDQEEALSIADEVVLMRDGHVVQSGAPNELYQRPANLWAARFLGEVVELPVGAEPFGDLPTAEVIADPSLPRGQRVATLRPEQIVADPAGTPGRVVEVNYFGHDALLRVDLGGRIVPWRTAGHSVPTPGEEVRLRVTGGARVFAG